MHALEGIKSDYLQFLSNMDFSISFVERSCKVPTQLAPQNWRRDPSPNSSDESDKKSLPHDYDNQPLTQMHFILTT